MTGRWEEHGYAWCYLTPDGAWHAHVYRADAGLTDGRPWLVYTKHTEGNDRFATLAEAKAHGERRLQDLLDATEALRGSP